MFLSGQQDADKEKSPQKHNTSQQRWTFQEGKLSIRKPNEEVSSVKVLNFVILNKSNIIPGLLRPLLKGMVKRPHICYIYPTVNNLTLTEVVVVLINIKILNIYFITRKWLRNN